jgi:integrase
MPLKLHDPRPGKSPNYTIRGTYRGVLVDRSAKTADRAKAKQVQKQIEREIDEQLKRGPVPDRAVLTFAVALANYVRAGGEDKFLDPILAHFTTTPVDRIDQAAIDDAAYRLYPTADNATRNRQVYTPLSAILKRAGVRFSIQRPKGAQGRQMTGWLWPEQAEVVFDEAYKRDEEFGVFLTLLCYTGLRLEEALNLTTDMVRISENYAFVPDTKNGTPRAVFLPPTLVAALANHPRGLDRPGQRVFRYHKSGALYTKLDKVFSAAKVPLKNREGFHIFRHTYGTWMRRYGGLDTKGLTDTGTWKDPKSAARYAHSIVTEEAQKAALLPVMKRSTK